MIGQLICAAEEPKQLTGSFNVPDNIVHEMSDICNFQETLKSFENECVTELDFTGIQQLTDEAFVALRKVLLKTKLRETIVKVNCTGCTNITDFGVEHLAQALPFLTQVGSLTDSWFL